MGAWAADSKSHVSHMNEGDFYGTEKSALIAEAGDLKIELAAADGAVTVLRTRPRSRPARSSTPPSCPSPS